MIFVFLNPMKSALRKIGALLLAVLMLASTISWTVEQHYCLGRLVDVAFFSKAQDCGMAMGLSGLEDEDSEAMPCCENEVTTIDGQDQLKLSKEVSNLEPSDIIFALSVVLPELFLDHPQEELEFSYHPPPKLTKEIYLLHEVFLI